MGTKTSLVAVTPAANHITTAMKTGRAPATLITLASEQIDELVVKLRILLSDMQTADPNISTINTLITNLS